MDDIRLRNKLNTPLVTGTQSINYQKQQQTEIPKDADSFQSVLQKQIESKQSLSFSKHAVERMEQRSIEISESSMERLHEGMELAEQKGLDDTLIIVDKTAFIVSVKNKTIITALSGNDLKGNVITNINGTVII